jgi:hypothetical protein
MVTVEANELIRRNIKPLEEDSRMAAFLENEEAWATWLGERSAETTDVKAVLETSRAPPPVSTLCCAML